MAKVELTAAELGKILEIYQELELKQLPTEDELDHEFSEAFEKRMAKLFRRVGKPYYPFIRTRARVAVSIAVLVLVLLTSTVMAVAPLRQRVFDFFQDIFQDHSIVTVDGDKLGEAPVTIQVRYVPSYIPAGYAFVDEHVREVFVSSIYRREDPHDQIFLTQSTKQSFTPAIDSEDVETADIELANGMKGMRVTKQNANMLVLHNDDYAFLLSSQSGDLNELIKFAESLTPEK